MQSLLAGEFPDTIPAFANMHSDAAGRLWLAEMPPSTVNEMRRFRIVDTDGAWIAMTMLYDGSVAATRIAGRLLAVFGGIAMLLAAVGLHGVMTLAVRRRTREFGIRVALGAENATILGSIFGSGMMMVAAGAAIGVLLALALGRFLGSLLHGVTPADVTTMAVATVVIICAGLISAWLPARRIRRLDPVRALRTE